MKKTQLKQIIREIIEESSEDDLMNKSRVKDRIHDYIIQKYGGQSNWFDAATEGFLPEDLEEIIYDVVISVGRYKGLYF